MSTGALTVYDDVPWVERPEGAGKAARLDARLPADRPVLRDRSFFERKSLSELAREQGVGPVEDIRVLAGGLPDDEDIDEMLEEIYRLREP